jgi:hypothetical protein
MDEQAGLIHKQMAAILADVGAVEKSRRNQQQNYAFRGIDDVLAALHPLFAKHGVYCTPIVEDVQRSEYQTKSGTAMFSTLVRVRHRFHAQDGSYVDCVTVGEGSDSGDKSANKAMAGAYKYALFYTFSIPTEEAKDSENDSPAPKASVPAPKARSEKAAEEHRAKMLARVDQLVAVVDKAHGAGTAARILTETTGLSEGAVASDLTEDELTAYGKALKAKAA